MNLQLLRHPDIAVLIMGYFLIRIEREEILFEYPAKVLDQNQFVLNLLQQFGHADTDNEDDFENITFTMLGREICEHCLCVLFNLSDWRYDKVKSFYRVCMLGVGIFLGGVIP